MKKVDIEIMHNALAMALHNLCVRNNINPQDFIKTMQETRKEFNKKSNK